MLHAAMPQENQATLLLADCELRLGENGKVIDLLRPMELQNPQDLAVAYMLGTALIRDKRVEEGQTLVNRILKNGDTAELRFLLGSQMFSAGDYLAAVKQFAAAIELNRSLPGLQSFYGQALLFTGDADGAAAAFKKELANDANSFESNLGLGQILAQRKQVDEARPYLEKAVRLRPNSPDALIAMGESQMALGKFDARVTLESAIHLAPISADSAPGSGRAVQPSEIAAKGGTRARGSSKIGFGGCGK